MKIEISMIWIVEKKGSLNRFIDIKLFLTFFYKREELGAIVI